MEPRQTEVVVIERERPEAEKIARAAAVLRQGGLVAFPTETVYGLGANALDAEAVERIFTAKGRPSNNPLIVHVPDVEAAKALVTEWTEVAEKLATAFWPGPLTLVLPRRNHIPDIVTGGGPTVGVRVPAHPVALALLQAVGLPIAAPSANRSEQLSPTTAEHVLQGLTGRIEMVLDGGPTSGGLESTVLNLTTRYPTLLRPGLITPAEIEAVVGPIKRHSSPPSASPSESLPSPGMMLRHYAPRAPLELITGNAWLRVQALWEQGEKVGWLSFHPFPGLEAPPEITILTMPKDPILYSAQLYATLHQLDAEGITRLVVEAPPESEAWLAVRDRLQRAATPVFIRENS